MDRYNWNSIPEEQMNPLVIRQVIHTENMTITRLRLKTGYVVPVHSHHNEQVTMVESGACIFNRGDEKIPMQAGDVVQIKGHIPHNLEVTEDAHIIELFSPRREDWISGDDSYLRK